MPHRYMVGQAAITTSVVTVSKLHCVQMYSASVLFGYFLRRADKRFSLAKSLGVVPYVLSDDETLKMLNDLHQKAEEEAEAEDPDKARPYKGSGKWGRQMTLREYIDGFGPEVQAYTTRLVSKEVTPPPPPPPTHTYISGTAMSTSFSKNHQ